MPRILIANSKEGFPPYDPEVNTLVSYWSMLILWYIQDHDIVILAKEPAAGQIQYIANLLGVNLDSLRIIVAPAGKSEHLSSDRIANEILKDMICKALEGRCISSILSVSLDAPVARLAKLLGFEKLLDGFEFANQGGEILANSKSVFRAIAAGAQVPIAEGYVLHDAMDAVEALTEMLLKQKRSVIVKRDFGQGGRSNEVLSWQEGVIPNGGRRGLVLRNRADIESYIDENWKWLTRSGQHPVIMERFFEGSTAIFAEFNITSKEVRFAGMGEMLARPVANSQVIPPVGLGALDLARIIDGGHLLASAMQRVGYRGVLSADAILTSEGEVLFSEYNGRLTGSTHMYSSIGVRIVGQEWARNRILKERRNWIVSSFQHGVDMLEQSGLGYKRETKTGVILSGTHIPEHNLISYTVVAQSLEAAEQIEEKLFKLSPLKSD